MTPHELNLIIVEKTEKAKIDSERDLLNAYMTAYFHRVDKLETFDTYLNKVEKTKEKRKEMTNDEMLEKVKQLNRLFGGNTNQ